MAQLEQQPETQNRRPGEAVFAFFLVIVSTVLLWESIGIEGAFDALSSPAAIPLTATVIMLLTSIIIAFDTLKRPVKRDETLTQNILSIRVFALILFLFLFGLAFQGLGFLPTAVLFLMVSIKYLSGRPWAYTCVVSLGSLLFIWLLFRVVFTVLLPSGFVPEAEIIQFFRTLFKGGQ